MVFYSTEFKNFEYDERAFLLVVDAASGHYVNDYFDIFHGAKDFGEFVASASGMFFDNYGLVYLAQSFFGTKGTDCDDGSC